MNDEAIRKSLNQGSSRKVKLAKLRAALAKELVEARATRAGRGLFARADFAPGEIVAPMDGTITLGGEELISDEVDDDYSIVLKIADGRFRHVRPDIPAVGWHCANHACAPNARYRDFLRATRAIARGDEIGVHYGWCGPVHGSIACLCGGPFCWGTIGPCIPGISAPDTGDAGDAVRTLRRYIDCMIANGNHAALDHAITEYPPELARAAIETRERHALLTATMERTRDRSFDYGVTDDRIARGLF